VLVQTFTPFSPSIQFARHHDYEGFMEQEMEFRRQFGYPPFGRMVLITIRGTMARARAVLGGDPRPKAEGRGPRRRRGRRGRSRAARKSKNLLPVPGLAPRTLLDAPRPPHPLGARLAADAGKMYSSPWTWTRCICCKSKYGG